MDYLHHASLPATKSELDLFNVPATQTAIDSYYEVEYRPTSTLDNAKTFDINIPASDDFTDLSETMIYAKIEIKTIDETEIDTSKVNIIRGFGAALFEQVDFYLNAVNISQSNNLYGYQAYIEEALYSSPSKIDVGAGYDDIDKRKERIKKPFDLYFKLHVPICTQENLLLNGVPILLKLSRAGADFGLKKTHTAAETPIKYKIKIQEVAAIIRRVRIFPEVSLGIQEALEKASAKYFVTRNEKFHYTSEYDLSELRKCDQWYITSPNDYWVC